MTYAVAHQILWISRNRQYASHHYLFLFFLQVYASCTASTLLEELGACVTADYAVEDTSIAVLNTARYATLFIGHALLPVVNRVRCIFATGSAPMTLLSSINAHGAETSCKSPCFASHTTCAGYKLKIGNPRAFNRVLYVVELWNVSLQGWRR